MAFCNRHLIALFVVLVCAFSGTLLAQAPATPKRFTVASHGVIPADLQLEIAPGKFELIEFRAGERSREYSTSEPLVFVNLSPGASPSAAPVKTRVAQATIPEGIRQALLLFVPNTNTDAVTTGERFRVLVFEDAIDLFPAASVRFLNASGLRLVGLVNKNQVNFGSGMSQPFSARTGLRVQLAMSHKEKLISSFDQEMTVEPTQRLICVLLPPESPKSPLVRWTFISDYIAPPSESKSR